MAFRLILRIASIAVLVFSTSAIATADDEQRPPRVVTGAFVQDNGGHTWHEFAVFTDVGGEHKLAYYSEERMQQVNRLYAIPNGAQKRRLIVRDSMEEKQLLADLEKVIDRWLTPQEKKLIVEQRRYIKFESTEKLGAQFLLRLLGRYKRE